MLSYPSDSKRGCLLTYFGNLHKQRSVCEGTSHSFTCRLPPVRNHARVMVHEERSSTLCFTTRWPIFVDRPMSSLPMQQILPPDNSLHKLFVLNSWSLPVAVCRSSFILDLLSSSVPSLPQLCRKLALFPKYHISNPAAFSARTPPTWTCQEVSRRLHQHV